MRSDQAPSERSMDRLENQGFGYFQEGKERFRVYSVPTQGGNGVIQVAETIGSGWARPLTTAQYFVVAMLLPFAALAGVTQHLLRRSLRPINLIANELATRGPFDLGPIHIEGSPEEIAPILSGINALFARIEQALFAERSFTAMAAHEMRTPLAGIRCQSEAALLATTCDERRAALIALSTGVDRSVHLLDQLLDLAQIEALPRGEKMPQETVALAPVYLDVLTDFGPRAAEKRISTRSRFGADAVLAHPFALYLIMRNLVANAILYTPNGGSLEIGSAAGEEGLVLTVDDSGPGIAQADHGRAFDRFNRLGQARGTGVGLGLSIVRAAVRIHGGRIRLLPSPLGGLRVEIVFGTA